MITNHNMSTWRIHVTALLKIKHLVTHVFIPSKSQMTQLLQILGPATISTPCHANNHRYESNSDSSMHACLCGQYGFQYGSIIQITTKSGIAYHTDYISRSPHFAYPYLHVHLGVPYLAEVYKVKMMTGIKIVVDVGICGDSDVSV